MSCDAWGKFVIPVTCVTINIAGCPGRCPSGLSLMRAVRMVGRNPRRWWPSWCNAFGLADGRASNPTGGSRQESLPQVGGYVLLWVVGVHWLGLGNRSSRSRSFHQAVWLGPGMASPSGTQSAGIRVVPRPEPLPGPSGHQTVTPYRDQVINSLGSCSDGFP